MGPDHKYGLPSVIYTPGYTYVRVYTYPPFQKKAWHETYTQVHTRKQTKQKFWLEPKSRLAFKDSHLNDICVDEVYKIFLMVGLFFKQ